MFCHSSRRSQRQLGFATTSLIETLEARLCLSTLTVTNLNDSGPGSLRQAIAAAIDNDTITFDSSITGTILLSSGLAIHKPLVINGPGSNLLTLRRPSTAPAFAVIQFDNGVLNLSGLTIAGGSSTDNGGGIAITDGPAPANVTLNDVSVLNNSSASWGGGIFITHDASLTIRNSTIASNIARFGGGIYLSTNTSLLIEFSSIVGNTTTTGGAGGGFSLFNPASSLIRNSTIYNNSAAAGGGGGHVHNSSSISPFVIQNSTFTGNTTGAGGSGGALLAGGAGYLVVQNTTITKNTSGGATSTAGGGGIACTDPGGCTLTVTNSIISGNISYTLNKDILNITGTTYINYSAIGSPTGFSPNGASSNNLPFGTPLSLGTLAFNGGPTQTIAPQSTSPLIDAGSNALVPDDVTTDQRGPGFPRISGTAVDIGAVEVDTILPAIQSSQFNYTTAPQSLRYTFSEPVTLDKSALELHNVSTNQIIPLDNIALAYDSATNTATFTFPGYANGVLPDGYYRGFLLRDGVQDPYHNHPATDHMIIFSFLLGDLNGDRTVSIADFIILASNFDKSDATYQDGDTNYDGTVSIGDFLDVAAAFGNTLGPPPPAAPQPAAAKSLTSDTLFSPIRPSHHRHVKRHHARPHLLFRFEQR